MRTKEDRLIMIVDDNPLNIRVLATILEEYSELLICMNGTEALEALKSEKPDLGKEQNDALYTEVMRRDVKFRESETKYLFENPYLGAMQLRYGYGITCHKAQGSEFDRVLLSTWTHKPNLPYLYTGITRARKELFIDVAYR